MIGQQVWEYSHQCDHEELRDVLKGRRGSGKDLDDQLNVHRDLLMRFKCTLTSRGRSVNIKSASYKVCVWFYLQWINLNISNISGNSYIWSCCCE